MESQSGEQSSPISLLLKEPGKFDFFQAVRLLLLATKRTNKKAGFYLPTYEIGRQYRPEQEALRFHVQPSYRFPLHSITSISWTNEEKKESQKQDRYELFVTILGLIGSKGVLPDHYNDLILQRIRLHDHTMRDFLDLFQHRTLSLLYRAWEKYRFALSFERDTLSKNDISIQTLLKSFYGNGTAYLENRLSVREEVFTFYAGFLSRNIRPAQDIERILQEYLDIPVSLQSFQKEYLDIPQHQLSCLGSPKKGQFHQLAKNIILGKRTKTAHNCFKVVLGSLFLKEFYSFLPSGSLLKQLCELIRYFVGIQFNFDIQLILKASEIPECRLQSKASLRLGWDTWLYAKVFQTDRKDLILKIRN